MEQKIKQQLGELLFTVLALQFKLEETTKKLEEQQSTDCKKEGAPSQT